MQNKYVAYVSTYTMGTLTNDQKSYGIKIYDVDLKNGRFTEKDQVEITNSSYVTISHNICIRSRIWAWNPTALKKTAHW